MAPDANDERILKAGARRYSRRRSAYCDTPRASINTPSVPWRVLPEQPVESHPVSQSPQSRPHLPYVFTVCFRGGLALLLGYPGPTSAHAVASPLSTR